MTGPQPMVGCLARFAEPDGLRALELGLQALTALLEVRGVSPELRRAQAMLAIGSCRIDVLVYSIPQGARSYFMVDADEQKVTEYCRRHGLTVPECFAPIVMAMQCLESCDAILLGFEASPPIDLTPAQLAGAGVSLAFLREDVGLTWLRKSVLPCVGHSISV